MNKTRFLILGSGMAGLGAAIALNKQGRRGQTLILEAEYRVGGLNSTTQVAGCDFDMGPKILLLDESENSQEILSYLGDNVKKYPIVEKVFLRSLGTYLDFPLQRYFVELPLGMRRHCLESFRVAQENPREIKSFKDWLINGFGEFFSNLVLIPYEEKKWQCSLEDMDYKWALDRPIKVNAEEIERGALEILPPHKSYYYPMHGNIGTLTTEMAKHAGPIVLGSKVDWIDTRNKTLLTTSGHSYEYEYDYLISTLPLDTFIDIDTHRYVETKSSRPYLKRLGIKVVNLVFSDEYDLPGTATYFPDKDIIFRRLSVLKNICPALARPGFTQVSAEISINENDKITNWELFKKVLIDLYSLPGFSQLEGKIIDHEILDIPFAYPMQLNGLTQTVEKLHAEYEKLDVYHCGRGGSYNYCNSDVAYKQGKDVVKKILLKEA